mgnify:CR=1 FL=1
MAASVSVEELVNPSVQVEIAGELLNSKVLFLCETLDECYQVIQEHEVQMTTRFVSYTQPKGFGHCNESK